MNQRVQAEIKLVAQGQLPGDGADKSGLTDVLKAGEEQIPHNRLGGFSAIAYTGKDNLYWVLPDRGPLDGATDFACRVQLMRILPPKPGHPLHIELVATQLLKSETGAQLVGSTKAFDATHPDKTLRFDPEGLRVGRNGQFFVSDEYGPALYEFSSTGCRQRMLPLPTKLIVEKPNCDPLLERKDNRTGRLANGGMEGLAISPDGSTLFGIMQNPLIQDQGELGHYLRIIETKVADGATREFAYRLEAPKLGISEILAINDHEFLCIERDSVAGAAAAVKKIVKVSLTSAGQCATDISQIASLPEKTLPLEIQTVQKSIVIDLLNPTFGLAGPSFPKKIEGLTFGPRIDGKISLIVGSDNDFEAAQPSRFFWFTLEENDLPGFQTQTFDE